MIFVCFLFKRRFKEMKQSSPWSSLSKVLIVCQVVEEKNNSARFLIVFERNVVQNSKFPSKMFQISLIFQNFVLGISPHTALRLAQKKTGNTWEAVVGKMRQS